MGMWQSSSSTALNGELDDIRLYDVALSESKVGVLFSGDTGGNNSPIIQVAATVDPGTVYLPDSTLAQVTASDPDGDAITYSWIKLSGPGDVDFTPNNSATAHTCLASFSLAGEYSLRVLVFDEYDTVSSDVDVTVLDIESGPEPVAHWPADEGSGTETTDVSGNGNNGALLNGTSWSTGISGTALDFDGENDKVDAGNDDLLDMGSGDFTIAYWLKMGTDQNPYPTIVAKGGGASYDIGYWMIVQYGRIRLFISNGSSRLSARSNVVSITDDTWHHIAAVIDRDGDVSFYVDGVPSGTYDISAFDGEDISSSKSLTMGIWQTSSSSALNGELDDIRLYDVALTESNIEIIYDLYADNKMSDNLTTQTITGVQVFPNPFNSSTTVIFELVIDQHINIAFYDLRGNRVEVLKDENMLQGRHSIVWNGRNKSSQELPNGMYILRIIGETNIEQKTIVKVN